jgi:hypothetical protein
MVRLYYTYRPEDEKRELVLLDGYPWEKHEKKRE